MAGKFVSLAIYQIDSINGYDPSFPIFNDFPLGGLMIRDVAPPLNAARGVLCYGAVRSWAHGPHEYYTNLSMAEIVALANTVDEGAFLLTEDGNPLLAEDDVNILVESNSMVQGLFAEPSMIGEAKLASSEPKLSWWARFKKWCAKIFNKINPFKRKMKKQLLTLLIAICSLASFGQGIKISALTEYTNPGDAGYVPVVVGGVTYKILPTNLLATTLALQAKLNGGNTFSGQQNFYNPLKIGTTTSITDERLKILIQDTTTAGFALQEFKTAADRSDLNMDGAAIVKHDKNYSLTSGYANTLQVYTLAGSAGTIIGNNNFIRADTMTTYAPTGNDVANGFVAIELGPIWPKSEKARWNNRGDFIMGWTTVRSYTASQSSDIITDPVNSFFSTDVGKFFVWSDQDHSGGKHRFADRIIEYIDANHIRVETSRTIASQWGRVCSPNAIVDTLGNIRGRIVFADSLRVGDENNGYYRFVPSSGSLKLLRNGSSSPDTLFDISGTSRLLTGRDIELSGSHYSNILLKNATTSLTNIRADATQTLFQNLTSAPFNFQVNGTVTERKQATVSNFFTDVTIGGQTSSIARLDVENATQNISAYIDNTKSGSGTKYAQILDVTASGGSENRGLQVKATGATVDKAIIIPNTSGADAADFAISSETLAKSQFAGDVITLSTLKAINSPASATAMDSAVVVNRSTGALEMRKLPAAGSGYTIVSVTSTTYNAAQTSGDIVILVDAATAGGNVTVNLPTAVSNTAKFTVKKIDSGSNTVTVDASTTETIDSALTQVINYQNTSMSIVSNNANWFKY